MLTPDRRLAVLTATAALVLVWSPGAQSAPRTTTSTVSAPYAGAATFTGRTSTGCDEVTVCEVSGSSDATTGRSTVVGAYRRSQPLSSGEGVFGRAEQQVPYSVPRGAETVTAVVTYRVSSASAAAAATVGYVSASAALIAGFSFDGDGCLPPECRSTMDSRRVVDTYGPYGLSGPPQRVTEPYTAVLTVTATGKLPRTLLLQSLTVAFASGGGEYGPFCLHWDGCDGPSLYAHAGTADVAVDATLLSVQFSAG